MGKPWSPRVLAPRPFRAHHANHHRNGHCQHGEAHLFAEVENTPAARLAAFDGLNRVVHIGFSKTLSASVRCGYIATPRAWIEGLVDLKIATAFGSCRLSSELVLASLRHGSYRVPVPATYSN